MPFAPNPRAPSIGAIGTIGAATKTAPVPNVAAFPGLATAHSFAFLPASAAIRILAEAVVLDCWAEADDTLDTVFLRPSAGMAEAVQYFVMSFCDSVAIIKPREGFGWSCQRSCGHSQVEFGAGYIHAL